MSANPGRGENRRKRALITLPFGIASLMGSIASAVPLITPPLTSDQVKLLKKDNVVSAAAKAEGLAIRSLQAEVLGGMQLRWQVLVIQATRNAPEFNGRLELVLTGTQDGKPWTQTQPAQGQPLQVKQYRRIEGVLDLPPSAVVKTVTARVLEGSAVRAVQAMTID